MAPLPKIVNIQTVSFQQVRNMNPQGMGPSSPSTGQIWPRN